MEEIKILSETMKNYELIDSGEGKRLEKFGDFLISKPDPQAIWKTKTNDWKNAQLIFENKNWINNGSVPESWKMAWENLIFKVTPTPFKHMGIFPEQVAHWKWAKEKITNSNRKLKILNLFGYTGAISLVCAKNGAEVTHVDASKKALEWLKENEKLSGIENSIRVINDDCLKFVKREITRGKKYDLIFADPPVFGHGINSEVWKFNEKFPELMENIKKLLSEEPVGILVNAYAVSSSSIMLANVFKDFFPQEEIIFGELCIKERTGRLFSTGIFARWES